MTVEILPPLPRKDGNPGPEGLQGNFAHGAAARFRILRVPPLLAGVLMIPVLLILLPLLLLTSLFFGFRLWRRVVMLPGLRRR